MGNVFHKNFTLDDNHAFTVRLYTDIAARDADTAFHSLASNINKVVRVEGPLAFYILLNNTPLWESLGASLNDQWTELLDTPNSISPGLNVQGNAGGTALEFGQALSTTDTPTFGSLTITDSVVINGATSSLSLSLDSTGGALRLNRLSNAQRALLTPLAGMTIFNTDSLLIEDYNGTSWVGATSVETFLQLTDTPLGYGGAGLVVQINAANNALEFGQALRTTDSPTFEQVNINNLRLDGNTLSTQDTDGNLLLAPNGLGLVDVTTRRIINVADPTSNQDAASKKYVDDQILTLDTFLELTDTPGAYGGAGLSVQINAGNNALEFGQNLTTTGSPTFGSATITGDLTVDTDTLIVHSTQKQVAIGASNTPLSDLTIFQGENTTKGITLSGRGFATILNTDGISIYNGVNSPGDMQLYFSSFLQQSGADGNLIRMILDVDVAGIEGSNPGGGGSRNIRIGNENSLFGNVGVGFSLTAIQADIVSKLHVKTGSVGRIGLIVQGVASQTADLVQIKNSTGKVLNQVQVDGRFVVSPTGAPAIELHPFGVAAGNTSEIRLLELVANGANYVGFKAPDLIAANITWTLPDADGALNQALITDGNGILSWETFVAGDVTGPGSSTDNAITRWNGVGGDTVQDSLVLIDDLGKVTIPAGGGLVVDVDTLIVHPTEDQVAIGAGNAPLTDLTIFQGFNSTKGITFSGRGTATILNTDGCNIWMGVNSPGNMQLHFGAFSNQNTVDPTIRNSDLNTRNSINCF